MEYEVVTWLYSAIWCPVVQLGAPRECKWQMEKPILLQFTSKYQVSVLVSGQLITVSKYCLFIIIYLQFIYYFLDFTHWSGLMLHNIMHLKMDPHRSENKGNAALLDI